MTSPAYRRAAVSLRDFSLVHSLVPRLAGNPAAAHRATPEGGWGLFEGVLA